MKQIYTLLTFLIYSLTYGQVINPTSTTTTFTAAFGTDIVTCFNGSGLDTFPSVTSNHAGTDPGNSFVANETTGDIDFNLGGTFNINGIAFWNQNAGGPDSNVGINSVTFFSSTDGVNYTLIPGAPTSFREVIVQPAAPETFSFTAVNASHIRMTVTSNHGGTNTGFAEIAFASGTILSSEEFSFKNSIKLFPNPSSNFIQVAGLSKTEKYVIFDAVGKKIKKGLVSENISINIEEFSKGIYFLKLGEVNTIRFIKE